MAYPRAAFPEAWKITVPISERLDSILEAMDRDLPRSLDPARNALPAGSSPPTLARPVAPTGPARTRRLQMPAPPSRAPAPWPLLAWGDGVRDEELRPPHVGFFERGQLAPLHWSELDDVSDAGARGSRGDPLAGDDDDDDDESLTPSWSRRVEEEEPTPEFAPRLWPHSGAAGYANDERNDDGGDLVSSYLLDSPEE